MKVNGKKIKALWYEDNSLKIIDQRKLPFKIEIYNTKTVDDVVFAIKEMNWSRLRNMQITFSYAKASHGAM